MPITAAQLEPGDILFKHSSPGIVSQAIAKGQGSHYDSALRSINIVPDGGKDFATGLTHVAMAAGPDDVMEFDEGGASTAAIIFLAGFGFVRGGMKVESRRGNRYEVFRSNNKELRAAAADKAELLWDVTHQEGAKTTASYGLGKMLRTALLHQKGKRYKSEEDFENDLNAWLEAGSSKWKRRPNLQFYCSHFVTYCYTWAAKEIGYNGVFGFDYSIGKDKVKISPTELYVRVDQAGQSHFQFKGTLYS